MKRLLLPLLLVCAPLLYGEVNFSGLNLSPGDQLLFQAEADAPGFGHYDTLFAADLNTRTMRQLTFFPEQAMLLAGKNELQIQNRFGVFRTDSQLQNMAPVAGFTSFVKGQEIQTGKINVAEASPDGRYLLYLKPVTFGRADLLLYKVADQSTVTVSTNVEMSLDGPEAVWSPDSGYFVYQKDDELYYFSIDQLLGNRLFPEDLRAVGRGTIENVRWNPDGSLFYVSGTLVYRIQSSEFFNRSLFSDLLSIGRIVGKVPFSFDPNFDRFWISPDGQSILLDKGGRSIFLYLLRGDDYTSTGDPLNLPYLLLPRNTEVEKVLWSGDGIITLLAGTVLGEGSQTGVYRLNLYGGRAPRTFERTADAGILGMVLSPDGTQVAVLKSDRVIIRDYGTWRDLSSLPLADPLHVLWASSDKIIVAGGWFTDEVDLTTKSIRVLTLSQPGDFGYASAGGAVVARVEGQAFTLPVPAASGTQGQPAGGQAAGGAGGAPSEAAGSAGVQWQPAASYTPAPTSVASDHYRVYLDESPVGSYLDMVMVRTIQGVGTWPLFQYPQTRFTPLATVGQPVDLSNFNHGSRIRSREVSLVFNAVDTVDGLTTILKTLRAYNLKCTFFINGEFMHRNPDAVREIANSGQEVGSLFYVNFNMTDARYRVDSGFVQEGLGRNEDEYYALTGKELSLLWHTPDYLTTSAINAAARAVGYMYIGRDVDPLDWVTEEDGLRGANLYLSAVDIVDRIMKEKKPGSIIPIRIGRPDGYRADYLFEKLDLLINALLSRGYSIVPVSTLVENAQ